LGILSIIYKKFNNGSPQKVSVIMDSNVEFNKSSQDLQSFVL